MSFSFAIIVKLHQTCYYIAHLNKPEWRDLSYAFPPFKTIIRPVLSFLWGLRSPEWARTVKLFKKKKELLGFAFKMGVEDHSREKRKKKLSCVICTPLMYLFWCMLIYRALFWSVIWFVLMSEHFSVKFSIYNLWEKTGTENVIVV